MRTYMKVLIIPDVHLKPYLFYCASDLLRQSKADRAVCLMDLPDDWNHEYDIDLYAQTYDAAIDFAKQFPDTLWCWGNHDLSYIWGVPETGYSSMALWTVRRKIAELQKVLRDRTPIRYVQRIDNVLFCHGGLTEDYVRRYMRSSDYGNADEVLQIINEQGERQIWNDASPIWYRPQYEHAPLYREETMLQVVGHTPVERIERKGNLISCDVFSTYRDGRPIGTQSFPVLDTITWEISEYPVHR